MIRERTQKQVERILRKTDLRQRSGMICQEHALVEKTDAMMLLADELVADEQYKKERLAVEQAIPDHFDDIFRHAPQLPMPRFLYFATKLRDFVKDYTNAIASETCTYFERAVWKEQLHRIYDNGYAPACFMAQMQEVADYQTEFDGDEIHLLNEFTSLLNDLVLDFPPEDETIYSRKMVESTFLYLKII